MTKGAIRIRRRLDHCRSLLREVTDPEAKLALLGMIENLEAREKEAAEDVERPAFFPAHASALRSSGMFQGVR